MLHRAMVMQQQLRIQECIILVLGKQLLLDGAYPIKGSGQILVPNGYINTRNCGHIKDSNSFPNCMGVGNCESNDPDDACIVSQQIMILLVLNVVVLQMANHIQDIIVFMKRYITSYLVI